jgi:hypothetical protein
MHLYRDVLDNQLRDVRDRRIGKVDGVVAIARRGRPPRLVAIELGFPTRMRRISERLGRWTEAVERRLGVGDGTPVRIRAEHIARVGIDVQVDVDADRTRVYAWERWVRRVFIGRIPGAGSGGPEAAEK